MNVRVNPTKDMQEFIEESVSKNDFSVRPIESTAELVDEIDTLIRTAKKDTKRPSWDEYFLNLLPHIASRSTCLRRQLGAIITVDNRLISAGYNGPPSGYPHCEICIKDTKHIPSGQGQNECPASHAETNAIGTCADCGVSPRGGTIYISTTPCAYCTKLIIRSGIKRIVCSAIYPDKLAFDLIKKCGIELVVIAESGTVDIKESSGDYFIHTVSNTVEDDGMLGEAEYEINRDK